MTHDGATRDPAKSSEEEIDRLDEADEELVQETLEEEGLPALPESGPADEPTALP